MARTDEERFKIQWIRLNREKEQKEKADREFAKLVGEKIERKKHLKKYGEIIEEKPPMKPVSKRSLTIQEMIKEYQKNPIKRIGEGIQKGRQYVEIRPPKKLKTSISKRDEKITAGARKIILKLKPKKKKRLSPTKQRARYNQMLKQRLAEIKLRKQIEAEQISMAQDPRFSASPSQESFLEAPDWRDSEVVETGFRDEFPEVKTKQQLQNFLARARQGIGNFGRNFSRLGQSRRIPQIHRPQSLEESRELIRRRNILNTPDVMFSGSLNPSAPRINLMASERTQPKAPNIFKEFNERSPRVLRATDKNNNILNAKSPSGRIIGF